MSTRNQKGRNIQQESTKNVSETITSPVLVENVDLCDQDFAIAGPSSAKSPRIENTVLEGLRSSSKEEITSEIRGLLAESQREQLKLLKLKTNESAGEQDENILENDTREFYSPTRCVRISSTLNDDTNGSRNERGF